jgi:serine/threonine protein kinase
MPDLIGQSIGRYHIIEQLGKGGMAVVYKAYDTRLERDVALKIIRKGVFGEEVMERMLKRFEREAKALARLAHPNIVPVIDYGEHDSSPYQVIVYLAGGTLKELTGQPMPWRDASALLAPVARALEYAHERGLVHRDVKPSNILLTEKGNPLLGDFGIAKLLESEAGGTLTGTGVGVGTPEYMSPEQGAGREVDGRSDIYSLGVVLYELVTGRKPYEADTPIAVVAKQMYEPLPRPREINPTLPEGVEKVLFKALAKKPEDRYTDMGAFAGALEKLAQATETEKQKPAKTEPQPVKTAPKKPGASSIITHDDLQIEEVDLSRPPVRVAVKASRKMRFVWLTGGILFVTLAVLGVILIPGWIQQQEMGVGNLALQTTLTPSLTIAPSLTSTPTNTFTPIATGTPILSSTTIIIQTPTATPFGGGLGWVLFTEENDDEGKNDIFRMNSDGTNIINLTNNPGDYSNLSWSPDGRYIVFSNGRGNNAQGMFRIESGGTGLQLLTSDFSCIGIPGGQKAYFMQARSPQWSPDESFIIFNGFDCKNRPYGDSDIYRLDFNGFNLINLTNNPSNDWNAVLSPDGNRIAFNSTRTGHINIHFMNIEGESIKDLYSAQMKDQYNMAWSPDGLSIAFEVNQGAGYWGKWDIYQINVDQDTLVFNNLNNLSSSPGDDFGPYWSPNGDSIMFTSERAGLKDIFLMQSDGTDLINLSNSPKWDDKAFGYTPDGNLIIFQGDAGDYYAVDVRSMVSINLTEQYGFKPDISYIWGP